MTRRFTSDHDFFTSFHAVTAASDNREGSDRLLLVSRYTENEAPRSKLMSPSRGDGQDEA